MTRVRLTNITFKNGAIEADLDQVGGGTEQPGHPTGGGGGSLPAGDLPQGYDSDKNVGLRMLVQAMGQHNLTPIGVQGHGQQIVAALKETYPRLDVYLSPSDAPVWPGFGSIDVTIDSGRGGWSFRPDGATPYVPKDRRG